MLLNGENLRTQSNFPVRRQLVKLSNDQFLLLLLRCLSCLPTVHSVNILDDVDNLLIFPQINLHYHSLPISFSLCHLFQDFLLWHCLFLESSIEEFKMLVRIYCHSFEEFLLLICLFSSIEEFEITVPNCLSYFLAISSKNVTCSLVFS